MTLATQPDERPGPATKASTTRIADSNATDVADTDDIVGGTPSLEAVELELAIDTGDIRIHGFDAAVRDAMRTLDGELLFDLPASGLATGFQRIAVVRVRRSSRETVILLVMLADDGDTIRVCEPDEQTAGLSDFARAFINVLERL